MSEPTQKQKEALCINDNTCVIAGAGTGKTYLLTQRYIKILDSLYDPNTPNDDNNSNPRILALTYTEKAASEMQNRILSHIHEQIKESKINNDTTKTKYWMNVLDDLPRSTISTIHSFCSSILREYLSTTINKSYFNACINSNFNIIEDIDKQELISSIINEILSHPPDDLYDDVAQIYSNISNPNQIITGLLDKYAEFSDLFHKSDAECQKMMILC
ncbi:MAG TPA: UvrD-helicase domain-containing protein [Methanocorpusculum sp.]|nr:UvrD-helicase domain-containing protein [Methanocorpusculum sp.]